MRLDASASKALKLFDQAIEAKRKRLIIQLEAEVRERNQLRRMYDGQRTLTNLGIAWTTKQGETILVKDMTPNHAANTVAMLERRAFRDAVKLNEDRCLDAWFEGTPLVTALRERAKDKTTIGDRIRDKRSLRAWEKSKGS